MVVRIVVEDMLQKKKPWSFSTNEERLVKNNGLLLCPNHDAMFDKHLIAFDLQGEIVISQLLDEVTHIFLNIHDELQIKLTEEQLCYMVGHYQNSI